MRMILIFLVSFKSFGGTSSDLLFQGKIANEFDESKVKIIDSDEQTSFLPRLLFPKVTVITQIQRFSIELHDSE
jgi:hypothetical protein